MKGVCPGMKCCATRVSCMAGCLVSWGCAPVERGVVVSGLIMVAYVQRRLVGRTRDEAGDGVCWCGRCLRAGDRALVVARAGGGSGGVERVRGTLLLNRLFRVFWRSGGTSGFRWAGRGGRVMSRRPCVAHVSGERLSARVRAHLHRSGSCQPPRLPCGPPSCLSLASRRRPRRRHRYPTSSSRCRSRTRLR
ncbi:uncharacterized protein SCHCODRAFT_02116266 [Schizophyllum commune H4-8]|uniref:uncharacterized protein n=1 Tax=Schizophyllum commune (strain H4-8 / FGSC 9210) TaxID=578458 RepID=UPI00215E9979|nr:uncharacterized protein SCHCODRAFT_02116266 [Schizophyllum commune H4-8]KAI5886213.1 hypothetical protein SCHCODRAFT_02116266 [Schizophyllum commune H4-8]